MWTLARIPRLSSLRWALRLLPPVGEPSAFPRPSCQRALQLPPRLIVPLSPSNSPSLHAPASRSETGKVLMRWRWISAGASLKKLQPALCSSPGCSSAAAGVQDNLWTPFSVPFPISSGADPAEPYPVALHWSQLHPTIAGHSRPQKRVPGGLVGKMRGTVADLSRRCIRLINYVKLPKYPWQ